VSTSTFWKALGINTASRMDIIKLDRNENDGDHIIHDLNYPFEKKNYLENMIWLLI
jgi:hypothetical protein